MKKDSRDRPQASKPAAPTRTAQTLAASPAKLDWLYAQSSGASWGISRERFAASLERSAEKRLSSGNLASEKLEEYLAALHLEDLALATACMEDRAPAWENFVK